MTPYTMIHGLVFKYKIKQYTRPNINAKIIFPKDIKSILYKVLFYKKLSRLRLKLLNNILPLTESKYINHFAKLSGEIKLLTKTF